MKDNIYSGDTETDYLTKDKYIDKLEEVISKKTDFSVLEIGADNGTILKKLKKFSNITKISAIEPNLNMHKLLSNVADNVYEDIDDIELNEKFDLIICIHVLDHIPMISKYINSLSQLLKKDGHIFGVVHDESSILSRILGKRWPAFCLQHPHLFNEFTIKKLFKKISFNTIEVYKTKNIFKFGYLISQLLLALFKINVKVPKLFNISLKLGNIGFIFKK
jgi:ubiquinone/menaquinone biosynthesis C-methylase UbiE